jgi:tubulin monoglycylase TTLL3/8
MSFNNVHKLLKYIDAGTGLSTQWIVQKYMENSLIVAKRKFDLRQWILVTSWNPLTIYFYNECYARFTVDEYSTDPNDLENLYAHLVNNSIGKNSENFHKTIHSENNVPIDGYMWTFETFGDYLKWRSREETGKEEDLLRNKIQPRMKEIAIYSLMCASEMIEHRKNSWELYGFDFMVDDNYNAWLIEINSSPACDYSTKVTERYVQKALVELLSVVLDVREWEAQSKKTRGAKPSTGGWDCIYQGPLLELPIGSFGTEIALKGEGVKSMNRRGGAHGNALPSNNLTFLNPTAASSSLDGGLSVTSLGGSSNKQASHLGSSMKKLVSKPTKPTGPAAAPAPAAAGRTVAPAAKKPARPVAVDDEDDDENDRGEVQRHPPASKKLPSNNQLGEGLAVQSYDDSDEDERQQRRDKAVAGRSSKGSKKAEKTVAAPASVAAAVPSAAVAIPIKTFTVDF